MEILNPDFITMVKEMQAAGKNINEISRELDIHPRYLVTLMKVWDREVKAPDGMG